MTLTLTLPAPLERRLADHAKAAGKTAEAVAVELLEQNLPREQTFREIMAPFAADVAESGMSEDEFVAFIEGIRQEIWDEKQAKAKAEGGR